MWACRSKLLSHIIILKYNYYFLSKGIDYEDTFALIIKINIICLSLATIVIGKHESRKIYVKNEFQ